MKSYPRLVMTTLLLVAAVVALAPQTALTQPGTRRAQDVVEKAASQARESKNIVGRKEPSRGPAEGIKIHGHWSIVIRNLDGSVASRNEFENALTTGNGSGNAALSQFLARQYAVGTWQISFGSAGNSSQDVCRTGPGAPVICFLVEPTSSSSGPYIFPDLTVQVANSGTSAFSITLSGTAKAAAAGAISNVATNLGACAKSVGPGACAGQAESTTFTFTSHALTTPISVQAGQSIDVTVVLTFA
jgi:hypothetical protein